MIVTFLYFLSIYLNHFLLSPYFLLPIIFIIIQKFSPKLSPITWFFLTFFSAIFIAETYRIEHTIFSDHNIQSYITIHFGENQSTLSSIKLLLVTAFIYPYTALRHYFTYLTLWNLTNLFGPGLLLVLISGIKQTIVEKNIFFLKQFSDGFIAVSLILMVSRSFNESILWIILAPFIIQFIQAGSKKFSVTAIIVLQVLWYLIINTHV